MTLTYGATSCDLDLLSQGKRAGHFGLVHSDNRHGFSTIASPLGIVRGGDGPTALICAGNHGDEYEGQIVVRRLFETLHPSDVHGGLILAPALNMPAVLDANRISPLDQGNLNRSFPGQTNAGPTKEIAGFLVTQLMPLADLAIDLHSGGKTSDYVDSAYFCLLHDAARNEQTRELAEAMALPFTLVVPPHDTVGDFDGSAHAAGCAMLSCELGGEGKVSRRALESGWQGVLRVLVLQGILKPEAAERFGAQPAGSTRFLDLGKGARYVTATSHGIVEPLADIGTEVSAEQPVAILRDTWSLETDPKELTAPSNGIIAVRRTAPLVMPGDHLIIIAPEYTRSDLTHAMATS